VPDRGGGFVVAASVLAATTVRRWAGTFPDQTRPGPVLLVPGYGGRKGALNTLAARLRADGRTATVISTPGVGNGDLVAQAAPWMRRRTPRSGPAHRRWM
jgi:alpha-beta hydrolase superfamily lysophospholipase